MSLDDQEFFNFLRNTPIKKIEAALKRSFRWYKPHDKQKQIHNLSATCTERLFLAGNRTGKTYCGIVETCMHATGRYPKWWTGIKFSYAPIIWACSPNYEMSRDIIQKGILDTIDNTLITHRGTLSGVSNCASSYDIKHVSGGISQIFFKSYAQGREKFQGVKCDFIHMDEEPPYDVYKECLMRITDVGDQRGEGRILVTMTPLKGYDELMHYFLEHDNNKLSPAEVINNRVYIKASWQDNNHLTPETIERLTATLTEYELEARRDGTPYTSEGVVYPVAESSYLVDPIPIPQHWYKFYGLDVGYTAPTAAVLLAHDRDTDTIYVYGEYKVAELTSNQHAAALIKLGALQMQGFCDPAINHVGQRDGQKQITDYQSQGLRLKTVKYAKEFAVDKVLERIRGNRFKVMRNCRQTIEEFKTYSRDKNGKIKKGNDHLMNALEFAVTDGIGYAPVYVSNSYSTYKGLF